MATPDDLFSFDNHMIHAEVHGEYIISPEFDDMQEDRQVFLLNHAMVHKQAAGQEQQDAMMQQAFAEGKLPTEQPQEGGQ